MKLNLLIVDDEIEILMWLKDLFTEELGNQVNLFTVDTGTKALELLNQVKFDVVLTDIKMPGMDGITLFREIKKSDPRCKIVFLTGYRDFDDMYQIIQHRDVRYLLKTEDDDVICKVVREALEEQGQIPQMEIYLEKRQKKEYNELLEEFCRKLVTFQSKHDPEAIEQYYHVAMMLLRFINENYLSEKIAFRIATYKLTKVDEHENWKEAAQYLKQMSQAVFDLLNEDENVMTNKALERVQRQIAEHPESDLSLTKLADIGGFNASYLSRLFKQKYGIALTDYVCQKRIERAKNLLTQTELQIQEVARRAGYLSSHSFARTFRNVTGMSPAEYRERKKE